MKVAYFLGALNRGGAETLILDICRQHENVPYDFVCVYRHEGNMSDEFKASGAQMIQVPKNGVLLKYILHVRRALLQEKVTIVHSQTPSNTLILALALVGTKIKVITTFHGHYESISRLARKIVYNTSNIIICVSEHLKRYTIQKWHLPECDKIQVVYNGIDFSKLDCAAPNREVVQESMKLCMVGSFVSGRSQDVIIKALHWIQTNNPDAPSFEFYFIGRRDNLEPQRYDDCVQYCEKNQLTNVHFWGNRDDVPSLLKSMDGFVYSTESDTFGIAVVEAIANNLPIIVNDYEVMQEICDLGLSESNKSIRFFKTEDIVDCACKIKNMLEDIRDNKDRLLLDCRQSSAAIRKKYSISLHIDALYSIYKLLERANI